MTTAITITALILLLVGAVFLWARARTKGQYEKESKETAVKIIKEKEKTDEQIAGMSDSDLDDHI